MRHIATTMKSAPTFLDQVQVTVQKVQSSSKVAINDNRNILDLPSVDREAVAVASRLSKRLQSLARNNDCRNCWMQRAHCICNQVQSIEHLLPSNIDRVFLMTHHKEIGLVVDTAKLLLMSMPTKARLVINGIGEEFQDSMQEFKDAIVSTADKDGVKRECLVLFPSDDAKTISELISLDDEGAEKHSVNTIYDIIIMDGTWQQARKIHQKYIPPITEGGPQRVCLSQEALDILGTAPSSKADEENGTGRQLRRHPIQWKEVSTLEATRLLFRDMLKFEKNINDATQQRQGTDGEQCYDLLRKFQIVSDRAALRQLGPPRSKA